MFQVSSPVKTKHVMIKQQQLRLICKEAEILNTHTTRQTVLTLHDSFSKTVQTFENQVFQYVLHSLFCSAFLSRKA